MELKQYNIEPTDENILKALCENTAGRNAALPPFLEIIDHDFVSTLALNGDWGSGKTFFIKQAILLLNCLDPKSELDEDIRAVVEGLFSPEASGLARPDISGPYRAVYYNAWLYDDHNDPIQSLLYFLSITFGREYGSRDPGAAALFSGALKALAKWRCMDLDALVDALSSGDLLADVKTMEEVKLSLQEAFHDLLGDDYSLAVFVDELDRCSPMYAVRFLERVKHFFDCPKVKFVFATNLRQLGATIQNFYGASFDSTKYLNKFFDFTAELPPAALYSPMQLQIRKIRMGTARIFSDFCMHLSSYFHFSLRDMNIFLGMADMLIERINNLFSRTEDDPDGDTPFFDYWFFSPVLAALSIYDYAAYGQALTGRGEDLILDIFASWPEGCQFAGKFLDISADITLQDAVRRQYRLIFGQGQSLLESQRCKAYKDDILNILSRLY